MKLLTHLGLLSCVKLFSWFLIDSSSSGHVMSACYHNNDLEDKVDGEDSLPAIALSLLKVFALRP